MQFEAYSRDGVLPGFIYDIDATTYDPGGVFLEPTGIFLYITLSSSTISAELYSNSGGTPGLYPYGGSGFNFTASEWWPYAKIDGTDYWDPNTGLFNP